MPPKKKDVVDPPAEVEGEDEVEAIEVDDDDDESEAGEGEYEVEAIVDHRRDKNKFQYLVAWKGYGPEHNTWEPEANVDHAQSLISEYWATRPKPDMTSVHNNKRSRNSTASQQPARKQAKTSKTQPKRSANGRGKKGQSDEEDFPPPFEETHTDEADKFIDVPDWEELVECVDTVERASNGSDDILVYLTMKTGEKISQPVEVAYKRCPQQCLQFYQKHLKWRAN